MVITIRRCKNCLIYENFPNVKLNKNRICNHCLEAESPNKKDTRFDKKKVKKEFEEYIKKIKGKNKYDCVLLFSGGKDSAYLLHLLIDKYGLNVLTVNVDNGLEPAVSRYNIKKSIDFFKNDHITVKPENDFFKRLYCHRILNPTENNYTESLCWICQDVIRSAGLNIAAENNIPLVVGGYAPDQGNRVGYSEDKLSKSLIPEDLYSEKFSEKDRGYLWDPKRYDNIPRMVHPLVFLGYPDQDEIVEILSDIGLIKKRKLDPFATNCYMMWLLSFLDLYVNNYSTYVEFICNRIRQGKSNHLFWLIFLPIGYRLMKYGLIKRGQINKALKYVDLSLEDIID